MSDETTAGPTPGPHTEQTIRVVAHLRPDQFAKLQRLGGGNRKNGRIFGQMIDAAGVTGAAPPLDLQRRLVGRAASAFIAEWFNVTFPPGEQPWASAREMPELRQRLADAEEELDALRVTVATLHQQVGRLEKARGAPEEGAPAAP